MSKTDSVQTAMALFSKYDVDGDGEITKEELKKMFQKQCEDEGIRLDVEIIDRQATDSCPPEKTPRQT